MRRQSDCAYRHNHACKKIQSLGYHTDKRRRGTYYCAISRLFRNNDGIHKQPNGHGNDTHRQHLYYSVQRFKHNAVIFFKIFGSGSYFRGKVFLSHSVNSRLYLSRNHKASRHHFIADFFQNRVAFTGNKTFVYLAFTFDKNTVGTDLTTGA